MAMYFGWLYDGKSAGAFFPSMPGCLELEPERSLQVTCVANDRRNLAHLRIADGGVRIAKLGMIEYIERFETELQNDPFMNREGFEERGVKVRPPWTEQRVATRIAVGVGRRSGERRRG